MSGILVGLMGGVGLALVWFSFWPTPSKSRPRLLKRALQAVEDDCVVAGFGRFGVGGVLALSLVVALITTLLALALTHAPVVAVAFGACSFVGPGAYVRARARRRRSDLRDVWPEAIDHVASAVRAGLALPEALVQLSERGPVELREPFAAFAHDYHASGRFTDALDRLKERLSDPVADRLVESLRIAREVGGTDLGRLLRTLSSFLREDARSRAELQARQSWTVNAARLALAAPWVVLLLMATRGSALAAYQEPAGALVLAFGAAASLIAYRLMLRLGRLPQERRVLR